VEDITTTVASRLWRRGPERAVWNFRPPRFSIESLD